MKLFTTAQIAGIDRYTTEYEPIAEIDLMERAAGAICSCMVRYVPPERELVVFAGPGNNGGDALAVARILAGQGYRCSVFLLCMGRPLSGSPAINWHRLEEQGKVSRSLIQTESDFPILDPGQVVVDGLFGSGLTRTPEGLVAALVRHINASGCRVCAIDVPSGLMGEDNAGTPADSILRATLTVTLQFPKISLLFAENEPFAGNVETVDIGLHPGALASTPTPYYLLDRKDVEVLFPPRARHSHKGTYGHALLAAGSYGKAGAAVLAARACLRSGAGLLTVRIPACGYSILQGAVPEAMCLPDDHPRHLSSLPPLDPYSAIGVGPGLGTHPETRETLLQLLATTRVPLVLDADALNILSGIPDWPALIPANSILTPHPGEFRRLAGDTTGSWERLQRQRELSQRHHLIIVLKGARTSVSLPDGRVFFNPTGNPGMATAGSGDLLTGMILGLLAQGMEAPLAACAGVYLHGLAGDLAAARIAEPALIASDIAEAIGDAFREIVHGQKQDFSYIWRFH